MREIKMQKGGRYEWTLKDGNSMVWDRNKSGWLNMGWKDKL